jgi:hypothetical protein
MSRASAIVVLVGVLSGCASHTSTRQGNVEWPDESETVQVAPSLEAGAALAAAAAVREFIRTNPFPRLFLGCSSPEQGLDIDIYKDPKSGLYYVVLRQRFDRCGGPRGRVLDWWSEYAVTPQGEVLAEAPPPAVEIGCLLRARILPRQSRCLHLRLRPRAR